MADYASLHNFLATSTASEVDVIDFPSVASMAVLVQNSSPSDPLYVTVDGSTPVVPSGPLANTSQVEVPASSSMPINTEGIFPLQVQVVSAAAAPYGLFLSPNRLGASL